MKIILELSCEEAHALNNIISQGYTTKYNCGYVEQEDNTALSAWGRAYTKAMPNDEE